MTAKRTPLRPLTPSEVAMVLAPQGVVPGPDGYAWADLTALAAQHRWHMRVEPDWTPKQGWHVRAMVWSDGRFSGHRNLIRRSAKGRGATDEAALAEALARLLWRERTDEP